MPRRIPTDKQVPRAERRATTVAVLGGVMTLDRQIELVVEHWATAVERSDQTRARMTETVHRFARRLAATGVRELGHVKPADARAFVLAHTDRGAPPEVATQHARRTTIRTLFRTARLLELADNDPTLDLRLPARGQRTARPLTDDEVILCRASVQIGRAETTSIRTTAWALGEAGAVSSEITAVRIRDLYDSSNPSAVRLPGTRRHDPRTVPLTDWGALVLHRRTRHLLLSGAPATALLCYGGQAPAGSATAQASACNALREVLGSAGLLAEPDVRPASLRNWTGRRAYGSGQRLDQVARLLGHRSLDATAEDIALTWR